MSAKITTVAMAGETIFPSYLFLSMKKEAYKIAKRELKECKIEMIRFLISSFSTIKSGTNLFSPVKNIKLTYKKEKMVESITRDKTETFLKNFLFIFEVIL